MSSTGPRLTPQTIAVLSVLLQSPAIPRYGLEIAQEAGVKTGTLHPILARLEQAGWLEKFWEEDAVKDPGRPRRRYYRFTPGGAEQARLAIGGAARSTAASTRLRPQPGF